MSEPPSERPPARGASRGTPARSVSARPLARGPSSRPPASPPVSWRRLAARALGIAGLVLALIGLRVVLASKQAFEEAERLRAAGEIDAAIVRYRRAAHWYAPGNPYGREAIAHLEAIALAAERQGQTDKALRAWRAVRAAIVAGRSFYVPYGDDLAKADRAIATHMAATSGKLIIDAGKDPARLRDEHVARLRAAVERRSIGWTLLALVGFATWVYGAFAFAARAIDDDEVIIAHEARRWALVVAVGFVLFALGLWFA